MTAKPEAPIGQVEIITRDRPVDGLKYQVDIAFPAKPDFSKIIYEYQKLWNIKGAPSQEDVWDWVILQARSHEYDYELWKFREPISHLLSPDSLILRAASGVQEQQDGEPVDWYCVRLFILSREELESESLKDDMEKTLDHFFGEMKVGRFGRRFVFCKKITKFPGEGRVLRRQKIPLTMSMINESLRKHHPTKQETADSQ